MTGRKSGKSAHFILKGNASLLGSQGTKLETYKVTGKIYNHKIYEHM